MRFTDEARIAIDGLNGFVATQNEQYCQALSQGDERLARTINDNVDTIQWVIHDLNNTLSLYHAVNAIRQMRPELRDEILEHLANLGLKDAIEATGLIDYALIRATISDT